MAYIQCPRCGNITSDQSYSCPRCGLLTPLGARMQAQRNTSEKSNTSYKNTGYYQVTQQRGNTASDFAGQNSDQTTRNNHLLHYANSDYQSKSAKYSSTYNYDVKEKLDRTPFLSKTWAVILMLIIFFPAGIYGMWRYNKFQLKSRLIITAFFAIILFLFYSIVKSGSPESNQVESSVAISGEAEDTKGENNDRKTALKDELDAESNNLDEPEATIEISIPPDIDDGLRKDIYYAIVSKGAEVDYINYESENSGLSVAFICANDEDIVVNIVSAIQKIAQSYAYAENVNIIVHDSDNSASNLSIQTIEPNGTVRIEFESPLYKSRRNAWVEEQFSAWDGSHLELTKLIKSALNDEKSYEHLKTSYINITDEATKERYNSALANAGYDSRVEINDIFITTEFSAKNPFNATIKATAYGIGSYKNGSTTLVGIEP